MHNAQQSRRGINRYWESRGWSFEKDCVLDKNRRTGGTRLVQQTAKSHSESRKICKKWQKENNCLNEETSADQL